ncbi:transaldolase family protein [Spirosoma oryzicola]|uniref:transaldolase family protein n=1 Tax=Spirosoma oryzicola TaxID=2898794 RepID=UPI0031342425
MEALIGPKTVNTVPMDTLQAYREQGKPSVRLSSHYSEALQMLEQVQRAGVDLNTVAEQLEKEGIAKFNQPYDKLLKAIDTQKYALRDG